MKSSEKKYSYILALTAALGGSSFLLHQALLPAMRDSFGINDLKVGWFSSAVTGGSFLGMLLLVPLGDIFNRKKLLILKMLILSGLLFSVTLWSGFGLVLLSGLLVGVFSTIISDVMAITPGVVSEESRAPALAMVMNGMVLGILLSRTFAAQMAAFFSWRAPYLLLGGFVLFLAFYLKKEIPNQDVAPQTQPLREIYSSMVGLVFKHRALRYSMIGQGFYGIAFMAFWSSLALCLTEPPFSWSLSNVGYMGLCAGLGIMLVPLFGKSINKLTPYYTLLIGEVLALGSFLAGMISPGSALVVIGVTIFFDTGFQLSQYSQVYVISGIDSASRGRLLAVYNMVYQGFRTVGATLGILAWSHFGWWGVNALSFGAICISTIVLFFSR